MNSRSSRFSASFGLIAALALSLPVVAQAQSNPPGKVPPQSITVVLKIPNKSPHDCNIKSIRVTSSAFSVECKLENAHGGDKVTRYAYSLRSPGAHQLLDSLFAARAQNKSVSVEFETDTKKNIEGCAKSECRNIVSLEW